MNANSNGSVTPVTNDDKAAANNIPAAAFFLLVFAQRYIAKAAAGKPNIITGKKPDIYIPSDQLTSAEVLPPQKFVKSPSPIVSNQNTLLSA